MRGHAGVTRSQETEPYPGCVGIKARLACRWADPTEQVWSKLTWDSGRLAAVLAWGP